MHTFADRADAGRHLAAQLSRRNIAAAPLVLGLLRGGVAVARPIARSLGGELGPLPVRKLRKPGAPELAMGAIALPDGRVLNREIIDEANITPAQVDQEVALQEEAMRAQVAKLNAEIPTMKGRTVVLVDDGIATGATMRAAIFSARHEDPAAIIVAVPVASPQVARALREEVDDLVCLSMPGNFCSVGEWYADFSPVTETDMERDLRPLGNPQ